MVYYITLFGEPKTAVSSFVGLKYKFGITGDVCEILNFRDYTVNSLLRKLISYCGMTYPEQLKVKEALFKGYEENKPFNLYIEYDADKADTIIMPIESGE